MTDIQVPARTGVYGAPTKRCYRVLDTLFEGQREHHYGERHRSVPAGGLIDTCTEGDCPEFVRARRILELVR